MQGRDIKYRKQTPATIDIGTHNRCRNHDWNIGKVAYISNGDKESYMHGPAVTTRSAIAIPVAIAAGATEIVHGNCTIPE